MRIVLVLALLFAASPVFAQAVRGDRFTLNTGSTIRSGTGAPASGLGNTGDIYYRSDSPYKVYRKTSSSVWSEISVASYTAGDLFLAASATTMSTLPAVATGQVLVSGGTGVAPSYSAAPSVTSITATGVGTGNGVNLSSSNPIMRFDETDAATDNGRWQIRADAEALIFRANDSGIGVGTWLRVERTGATIDSLTLGGANTLPETGYLQNLGSLQRKFLTLHAAELWVETLVAQNTIATIGGRILVGPTTTLVVDLAAAGTTMTVKHNQMAVGDRAYMEADGKVEFFDIAAGPGGVAGAYTYTLNRNLDGTGANDWYAGDAVFNTGIAGDGYIDLYSISGVNAGTTVGPTIVGNVRTGAAYSAIATRWAMGNLRGLFNFATDVYGAAFGDPTATHILIDPTPSTGGFIIRNGTTDKFKADTAGNLSIVGDLSVGTSGIIRSGATNYTTGTGYVLDFNGGTPRMRIGTTAGNRLDWDGTNLTLVSANASIGSSGVSITPSTILSSSRAYSFVTTTGNLGVFGADPDGGGRHASLISEWTGVGNYGLGTALKVSMVASNNPSSGGTVRSAIFGLNATGSAAWGTYTGDYLELGSGSGTLRLQLNGAAMTTRPYISVGLNSMKIEARSTANGGSIQLGTDNNTEIYLGLGGGRTYQYNAYFISSPPRWDNALAQSTVGVAGAASALPANPVAYIKIADQSGNVYVIPIYNP